MSFIKGIDVSVCQQTVDWKAVAASGVRFAFIKATQGALYKDPAFNRNWDGAAEAGLYRGAYHFVSPSQNLQHQVNAIARAVRAFKGDLPPALDFEGAEWDKSTPVSRVNVATSLLRMLEQSVGAKPIAYLSPAFAVEILKSDPALAVYPLWVAHYTNGPSPTVPKPWKDWAFWQTSGSGHCTGVTTACDTDLFQGDEDALKALLVK